MSKHAIKLVMDHKIVMMASLHLAFEYLGIKQFKSSRIKLLAESEALERDSVELDDLYIIGLTS